MENTDATELSEQLQDLEIGAEELAGPHEVAVDSAVRDLGDNLNAEGIEDDGEGEWITPSNLDKHRARDKTLGAPQPIDKMLQVALLTTDYAMRNVALRVNLK